MMPNTKKRYNRILLKLSGETLGGKWEHGLDVKAAEYIAGEVSEAHRVSGGLAIVIGGGNFIRGATVAPLGIDRATADYMGMLGTVINALALQSVLERHGLDTRAMTALSMMEVAEPFIRRRAIRHLEKGRVVIFAGGTGSTYFSTDTAAALRASEIGADVILKGTNVAGVYAGDPKKDKNAKLFSAITPTEIVEAGLRVMDLTAVTLSMENKIPVIVFDVFKKGNLARIVKGENIGTVIQ